MASSADTLPPGASFIPGNHVGVELQEARLRAGLDLRLVAEDLRIRYHQLLAIEEGRFQDLPGPTYATGFIRAYAEHLGLNAEDVVRRHKAGPGPADGAAAELEFPAPARDGGLSAGTFLLVALVLAGLGFGGWYWMSSSNATLGEVVAGLQARVTAWVEGPDEDAQPEASGSPAEDPQVASAGDAPEAEAGDDPATADAAQDTPPASTQEASDTDPLVTALDSPPDRPEGTDGAAVADGSTETGPPADREEGGADQAATEASPTTTADNEPLSPEPPAEPASDEGTDGAASGEAEAATETGPATEPGTDEGAVDSAGDDPDAAAPAPEENATDPQTATVTDESAEQTADAGTDTVAAEGAAEGAEDAATAERADAQAQDPVGEEAPPTGDEAQAAEETPAETEETATAQEEAAQEEAAQEEAAQEEAEEEEPTPAYVGRPAPASVRDAGSGSRIVLRANRDSWIQVREGGDLVVRRLLRRGDTYVVPLGSSYTLNTTNAGGLEVYVDGRRRPNLGPVGAARNGIRLTPGALN